MLFPDEFILDIKYRNDIEDVVTRYVSLKSSGTSTLVGCCPFHSEKTPSFTIFTQNKRFFCFGCGIGGDVITFVMRAENLDYRSAIIKLAEWANIPLPVSNDDHSKIQLQKRMYELNKEAALYFHQNLMGDGGKDALAYLRERKLQNSTIKHFGLGYASESWDIMTKTLIGKGFTYDELKSAFLSGISKKGGYIDYFRGRIIFPILDLQNRVIGFGGRAMGEAKPKYLNTSDTAVFKKSANLYALNFAKNSKADYLIMCEGYMDVIAMHQAGFDSAAATLGTAVTSEQARIVKKYTKKAILCYDSDEAGRRAAEKAVELLKTVGTEVRILNLKDAKDPDEYIKKFGSERFLRLINESRSYIEEKIDSVLAKYYIKNEDEKIRATAELCGEISRLDSPIEQEVYGVKISKILGISPELILKEIKRLVKTKTSRENKEHINLSLRKSEGYGDRINPDYSKNPRASKAEEQLLGILLIYPEYFDYIKDKLSEEMFFTAFGKKVYSKFKEIMTVSESYRKFDVSFLLESFTPEESGRITKMIIERESRSNNNESEIDLKIKTLYEEKEKMKEVDVNSLDNDEWEKMMKEKRMKNSIKEEGTKK